MDGADISVNIDELPEEIQEVIVDSYKRSEETEKDEDESTEEYLEKESTPHLEPWVYVEDKVVDLELEEDYEKRV